MFSLQTEHKTHRNNPAVHTAEGTVAASIAPRHCNSSHSASAYVVAVERSTVAADGTAAVVHMRSWVGMPGVVRE